MKTRALILLCILLAAVLSRAIAASQIGESEVKFLYPESIKSGARKEHLQARGVFDIDDLFNITGVEFSEADSQQLMRIHFKDDVFYGGTEGYAEDWLAANGVVSEALADLDGDGREEYLLVCLVSQSIEEDYEVYWENQWSIAIYEQQGDGYALKCEFPVDFSWWGERSISLVDSEGRSRILVEDVNFWDGGHGGVTATLYGYDGNGVTVDAHLYASVGEDSFLAIGLIEPRDVKELWKVAGEDDPAILSEFGLRKGGNYWAYDRIDWEIDGRVFEPDDNGGVSRLNSMAFIGFDQISAKAKDYGIHAFYIVDGMEYALYVERGAPVLLWAREDFEDNGSAYIDIITHYIETPLIDSTGREGNLPYPKDVLPRIPKDTGKAISDEENAAGKEPAAQRAQTLCATGDVNLRDKPSLKGKVITGIPQGTLMEYLDKTSTDDRGVKWYKVRYNGKKGWVSSKYSKMSN